MIGAIAGDIIGSVYEFGDIKTKTFPLFSPECIFTDDTVLTVALADSILTGKPYVDNLKNFFRSYPKSGYGGKFYGWARSKISVPYNSWGNGAAMRISPAGYAFDTLEDIMLHAKKYTEITHDHPEGIKGAQATATAIFLSRQGKNKEQIKKHIEDVFEYDLSLSCDEIRPAYKFNESCQGTVPQAIRAFIDSTGFEDAIRNAVSLGGDADTLACITGGIAQAFYGSVPESIQAQVYGILDERLGAITRGFLEKYSDKQ